MTDEQIDNIRPLPDDFSNYVPWACNQLQVPANIIITKVLQNEYISAGLTDRSKRTKSRIKLTQSKYDLSSDQDKESTADLPSSLPDQKNVKIIAVYDIYNNLVEIKFLKNEHIPRLVMKVIGLIVQFYFNLNKIVINSGLDKYTLYELNKIIKISNITEVYLDNTYLSEANYSTLIESENNLRLLSLSKCKINDLVTEQISKKLVYPLPASKTLAILNLSINRITDVGAKYLAEALRTNRKLNYLNLSDNRLTDEGAQNIFNVLMEFPLKPEELQDSRSRRMVYLKEKTVLIDRTLKDLKASDVERKPVKKKSPKPVSAGKSKLAKESSLKSMVEQNAKSIQSMDSIYYDKAITMVENVLGEFNDPFSSFDIVSKDGVVYCTGNNILLYLNIAYNNLTYFSLEALVNVLMYQKVLDRKPRGLISVLIDGNHLPTSCKELTKIEDIIETEFVSRRLSATKKRAQSKTISR